VGRQTPAKVTRLAAGGEPLAAAVAAFLTDRDLAPSSHRVYVFTLARLTDHLGPETPVEQVSPRMLAEFMAARYPHLAAASWNRVVATLGSFFAYTTRQGWTPTSPAVGLERHRHRLDRDAHARSRAIPAADLLAFLRAKHPVRDKTLWWLRYESAARAGEVLALDIDDLDLPRRRAVVIGKGGRAELIGWETRTARLLPRHLAGREQGPLFLTDLAPAPARQPCACRKSPPCRSSGMVVLVEDAAEPISSADVQPGEVVQIGDRFRQGLKGPSIGDALVWSVRVVERLVLRASRNARARTDRTVRGRPRLGGRDTAAWRRAITSRCQRRTVSGRTSNASSCSRPREPAQQGSKKRPIGRSEPDLLPAKLTLQHGDLVAQRQDLGILVTITTGQQPQQREGVGDTEVSRRTSMRRHHGAPATGAEQPPHIRTAHDQRTAPTRP
jgi:hypothetical protein